MASLCHATGYPVAKTTSLQRCLPSILNSTSSFIPVSKTHFSLAKSPLIASRNSTSNALFSRSCETQVRSLKRLVPLASPSGDPNDPPPNEEKAYDRTVNSISTYLGKVFGSGLWFAVLLVSVGVFGGGYVYLIYNFADLSTIPILNGPQGVS
eukprot:TRINITY_DN26332_c0_g1_i1.p1 TRINITY_DN26332_c0_g1~~TRINITY_DN26332_c0_g1_i1.p1  ORF type:complete len:153 (+),score=5.17 TRINITY_DN26332_c0_g1_i1:112-570(+)